MFDFTIAQIESPTNHHIAIVFQPAVWASPTQTKRIQLPDDQIELEELFSTNMCAKWKMTYGQILVHLKKFLRPLAIPNWLIFILIQKLAII